MDTTRASLDGKVAIVTGAGRGLGRGIAEGLAAFGAKVVIAERKADAAHDAEQAIRARGGVALAIVCDVRDGAQVEKLIERAASELGGVDILVNNVGGIYLGRDRPPSPPFLDMTESDWDDSYRLNLKTVFLCTSAAGRAMVQQGRGGSIRSGGHPQTPGRGRRPLHPL